VTVEVEAIAAQEVDHCLEFGLAVEVEAPAAQEVDHCLEFGLAVDVEATAALGRRCTVGLQSIRGAATS
jgi:hypothetical protein